MVNLVKMYNDYKDRADFLAVYIREAHPQDEWQMKSNVDENVCYPQPKTFAQRLAIANDFTKRFDFPLPVGVDAMTDAADHIYAGWPERLYVIDEGGNIVYRGGLGPFNYHPEEVRAWLAQRFASTSAGLRRPCENCEPRPSAASRSETDRDAEGAEAALASKHFWWD